VKKLLAGIVLLLVALPVAAEPNLIVVLSIDQMRYEYLERFAPWFSTGGFNRFLKDGATFTNTRYLHAVTFTGPGHATIGSGENPAEHGIVGNHWFERGNTVDEKRWDWYFKDMGGFSPPLKGAGNPAIPFWYETFRGSPRYCVYDDSVSVSEGKTAGMSPRSLIGEGLGDRVKDKYPGARVIGMSIKDRAAVLMAGRKADAAYWFDPALPGFVSSTYYHFDPKLFAFNATVPGYIPGSHQWVPSGFIPDADLKRVTFDPPAAWPMKNTRYGGTFPHPIKDIKALEYTPFANDILFDFALTTIAAEGLGTHTGTPDVLFVSVSSTDYYGHYYGPDSMEVADGMVRLDRSIERFLTAIERRFGDKALVALTADHGVQSTPEVLKLRDPHADAGRIDLRNPGRQGQRIADLPALRIEIERQLAIRLHVPFDENAPYSNALVFFFEEPSLYLNNVRVRELKLDPERVKVALRNVMLNVPGVDEAWTDTELRTAKNPSDAQRYVLRSFLPARSGDVFVTLKPNWIWTWGSNSTTHGQPVENDMHVPLLFWGEGVKRGRYAMTANPDDLARTLGAAVGVQAGGVDSHILPVINADVLGVALKDLNASVDEVRIDKLEVSGDRATVTLWTGARRSQLDCGVGHTYILERNNGKWEIVSRGVMQC
jgi:predicted AlkP superfamily pyrophosphatase or phosphodiesterase